MRVKELMVKEVVSVRPDELTGRALEKMKAHRIRHLVVIDEAGEVVGVISDRDLRMVTNVTAGGAAVDLDELHVYNVPVRRVMAKDPVLVTPDTTVRRAAVLITEKDFHSLPVRGRDGNLLGIITDQDVLRAVADGRLA